MFSIVSMLSVFSIFSVFSQITPRKGQFLEPWRCLYFLYEMESSQMDWKVYKMTDVKQKLQYVCSQPWSFVKVTAKFQLKCPVKGSRVYTKMQNMKSIEHFWQRYLVQAKRELWTKDNFAQGMLCYGGECTFSTIHRIYRILYWG